MIKKIINNYIFWFGVIDREVFFSKFAYAQKLEKYILRFFPDEQLLLYKSSFHIVAPVDLPQQPIPDHPPIAQQLPIAEDLEILAAPPDIPQQVQPNPENPPILEELPILEEVLAPNPIPEIPPPVNAVPTFRNLEPEASISDSSHASLENFQDR